MFLERKTDQLKVSSLILVQTEIITVRKTITNYATNSNASGLRQNFENYSLSFNKIILFTWYKLDRDPQGHSFR